MYPVNLVAVLFAGIANMVLGMVWFSPGVMGKPWTKLMGMSNQKMKSMMKKGMGTTYGLAFVSALVQAFVLGNILLLTNMHGLIAGAMLGFLTWLGFVLITQFTDFLFSGKSFQLLLINTTYQLISLMTMGAIVGMWR